MKIGGSFKIEGLLNADELELIYMVFPRDEIKDQRSQLKEKENMIYSALKASSLHLKGERTDYTNH